MREGQVATQQIDPDAFGNALGSSLASESSGVQTQGQGPWSDTGYRNGSDIESDNATWDRHVAALSAGGGGVWDDAPLPSIVDQYAQTYGGDAQDVADKLILSNGRGLKASGSSIIKTLQAREINQLQRNIADLTALSAQVVGDAPAEMIGMGTAYINAQGEETFPTLTISVSRDDWQTNNTGNGLRAGSLPADGNTLYSLGSRFVSGAVHGALDMVWQPVAQVIDLTQAAGAGLYGLATGSLYEPRWSSATAQNYAAGMSWGEVGLRSMTGVPLVGQALGVGLASYDLTSSALQSDWGSVAEQAGGLVVGAAAVKYGQRYMLDAPEPGAQLGIYRNRPQVDIVDPNGLVPALPGSHAVNFNNAKAVRIGDESLYRVFDNVYALENGAYWTKQPYSNETAWRNGVSVPEHQPWNQGTLQGEWRPFNGYAWGGPAAPQPVSNRHAYQKWGFTAGWIQPGGDYQIWVPNSRSTSVIPSGSVLIQPTPWNRSK